MLEAEDPNESILDAWADIASTDIVDTASLLPGSPLQVRVKLYVFASFKTFTIESLIDIESDQSPLATQEVAFEDDQLIVTESPTVTVCDDEENEIILGFTILTGGLVCK